MAKIIAKIILSVGGGLLLLVILGWLSQKSAKPAETVSSAGGGELVAENSAFDFGEVSMARGVVNTTFAVRNQGGKPIKITRVYTSCICTEASLVLKNKEILGPFGMPGHGFIPRLNVVLESGESATVMVTFDPAAHGPTGIGRVSRSVYLENDAGAPLTLNFTAKVVP
jgi:hypothetical protein